MTATATAAPARKCRRAVPATCPAPRPEPEVVDCREHGNVPARVAALLDAGCPGHVRDLFEDLAAKLGQREAVATVRAALAAYRMDCVFRRQAWWEPNVQHAQELEGWLREGRP
jgi:hypothetical protein